MVKTIHSAVVKFAGSSKLADDVTIVAARVETVGPPIAQAKLSIQSNLNELRHAREFVRSFCRALPSAPFDEGNTSALELAVNEALSNIMRHAYAGRADQPVRLEAEAFPGRVVVKLCHCGNPFSPEPPTLPPLDGSTESGFGLYILSQCVDDVRYFSERSGGNRIVLTKLFQTRSRNEGESPWKSQARPERA
jgi:anti-sigma regulatory factor (Ser/Thr protein kinase)